MLTIFTAIGNLSLEKIDSGKRIPFVRVDPQDCYAVCPHELILWSGLAFRIMTKNELQEYYNLATARQELPGKPDFDYILRRLLVRGIVVEGTGRTAVDALYRLLGQLRILPVKDRFHVRLFACIKLWLRGQLPLRRFLHYMQRPQNTPMEALLLKLVSESSFSVAQLIGYLDAGSRTDSSLDETPRTDSRDYVEYTALHHTQYPVLQGVANLYLKKQILFLK